MRTTVNIDEHLLRQARERAAASGRSLGQIVDDALRILLSERAPAARGRVVLPTYGGTGLQPGIDLEDKDALSTLLDEPEPERAAG